MIDYKSWYTSKGVWGSLIALLAIVAGFFGIDVSEADQSTVSSSIAQIVAGIGALIALYGRIVAKSKIG